MLASNPSLGSEFNFQGIQPFLFVMRSAPPVQKPPTCSAGPEAASGPASRGAFCFGLLTATSGSGPEKASQTLLVSSGYARPGGASLPVPVAAADCSERSRRGPNQLRKSFTVAPTTSQSFEPFSTEGITSLVCSASSSSPWVPS